MVKSVVLLGATGTIGRATERALIGAGHSVTTPTRDDLSSARLTVMMQNHDAVISCIASRSGTPADAMAVDHDLNLIALQAAVAAEISHFVLLSAICVQKPFLAFQHAKLRFEAALQEAPLTWTIVRPTAYFKSLSGQLNRLRAGKPFLLFGNGALTACKPISDNDLGGYLCHCIDDASCRDQILPIGGPGPAITPRAQGKMLFAALEMTPKFKKVPIRLMSVIIRLLGMFPPLRDKAELARIGRYYATESMLVWNLALNRYDADLTPEWGQETLQDHYRQLATGSKTVDLGDHAVF